MSRGLQVFRYDHSLHVCYALKTALALVPRGLQVFRYLCYVFFPSFTIYIFNTTTLHQLPFLKTSPLKIRKRGNKGNKRVKPAPALVYVDFQGVTFA